MCVCVCVWSHVVSSFVAVRHRCLPESGWAPAAAGVRWRLIPPHRCCGCTRAVFTTCCDSPFHLFPPSLPPSFLPLPSSSSCCCLQCSASAAPRRRSLQMLSSCDWTTCCWRRACPGPRREAVRPQRRQQPRLRAEPDQTTLPSTRTTGPSSPRSGRSTTPSWRSMNR